MVFAVVTGGGTSGHVIPARAIIEGLIEAGHGPDELKYVGSRRGVERTLMADMGVECVLLPVSGLQRGISLRSLVRNLQFPFRVVVSRMMARRTLARWSPRVVVSVGGYASDPMSAAAVSAGVPLVCVSYDRSPGLATKRQAVHARVCAVAFEGSVLPNAVVTGAPVRAELRHLDLAARRESARRSFGVPEDSTLVTFVGGSLGSGVLNSLVHSLVGECVGAVSTPVAILHLCGERFLADDVPSLPPNVWYRRVGYVSDMASVYSATDLLVSRAGASSVAEIATVGLAAVIVPWSGAADDHQTANARWLGDADAAIVMTEDQCADGSATRLIIDLLNDEQRRLGLATAARAMGALHRGGSLSAAIENAAR